jgi:predicted methyltransferase
VLSKAVRCYEHDLQQLREIRDAQGLSFETLVSRFRDEMDHVVGDPARIRSSFLLAIEDLFGEVKRISAERLLGTR